ncbi:MAG: hypothetical protein F6K65_38990, partial [Moorea sp. SIO3C2]|nr:hypothetical protein [Moorena sp. SIO3C2]
MPGIFDSKVFTRITVYFQIHSSGLSIDERGNQSGEPVKIPVRFKIGKLQQAIAQELYGVTVTNTFVAYCLEKGGVPKTITVGHTGVAEIN